MVIRPIFEADASADVKQSYADIKSALKASSVPLFFTYIGPFPDYLHYITRQLTQNLTDPQFIKLTNDLSRQIYSLIQETISPSDETADWLSRYKNSPAFYNFQKNNDELFVISLKLAMVFTALREAVKGWAIAAKKLPASHETINQEPVSHSAQQEFIFGDILSANRSHPELVSGSDFSTMENSHNPLTQTQSYIPEKDLLSQYLQLCQSDFLDHIKKEEFLIMRLGMEKIVLASLDSFPNLIFSPINVVLNLTSKYPTFPELLYLLSEHFPTYSMQRMIFTGYMKQ